MERVYLFPQLATLKSSAIAFIRASKWIKKTLHNFGFNIVHAKRIDYEEIIRKCSMIIYELNLYSSNIDAKWMIRASKEIELSVTKQIFFFFG